MLGVRAEDCRGVTTSRYGYAWRIEHPDNDAVAVFAASNPWGAARWLRRLNDLNTQKG